MATRVAARKVLVLATVDDCSGRSNREDIDGAIHTYRGKTRFSMEGFEDVGAVMGEAIPGACPMSPKCHYSPSLPNEKSCKKPVMVKYHFLNEVDILGLA